MTKYWPMVCAGLATLALTFVTGTRPGRPTEPPKFRRLECHDAVHRLAFSPDGKTLAAGCGINSRTGEIKLWDLSDLRQPRTLSGHRTCISSLAFAPDGKTLATGSWDAVTRWDIDSGQPLGTQREDFGPTHCGCLAFRPDLKQLAVSALTPLGPTLRLGGISAGGAALALDSPESVTGLAFSPDGRSLAVGSAGPQVRVYDTATGTQRLSMPGEDNTTALAFAPDGQSLAAGDWRGRVCVWDVTTAKIRTSCVGDPDPVFAVAFSPDGKRLAVGHFRGSLRLWDVSAGAELGGHHEHADAIFSAAFSPDGRWLATGSLDTTIGLWRLDPP